MTTTDNRSVIFARLRDRIAALRPDSPQMAAAFHKIGLLIVARAKMNATRLGIVDRGGLRESIRYEFSKEGDAAVLRTGSFGIKYAALNEFGGPFTKRMRRAMFASMRSRGGPPRPSKGVIQGGRFKARPYLRPAFKDSRDFIITTLREVLK